ncbi:MAG: hypothetical protein K5656_01630 [Lachnospiraceae bacterium]|nr:hypothetical protein [Lachnospiraceae bacterium]
MKSLNKAFMEVYGEALAPYGFKRVKGRQPYIVRVINDEIVHVLTVIKEDTADYETSGFRIYAGVATVYRLKIDFDEKPYYCREWLVSIDKIYQNDDYFEGRNDRFIDKYSYIYGKNEENALMECMRKSLEGTKEVALRVFEKINNLKMCISFWERYSMTVYTVHNNMLINPKKSNEGVVALLAFDTYEKYNEYLINGIRKRDESTVNDIKLGRLGGTVEDYMLRVNGKRRKEVIKWKQEGYLYYKTNENNYNELIREINKRKESNIDYLNSVLV